MADEIVDEVKTAPVEESASDAIRRGYERIAEPEKVQEPEIKPEPEVVQEQATLTEDTPPAINGEQLKDLMARVEKIPDLEKRLRDEGGRYGALKQSIEQLQQKIAESTTSRTLKPLKNGEMTLPMQNLYWKMVITSVVLK